MSEPECFIPVQFRKRNKDIKQGSMNESVNRNELVQARVANFCKQSIELYNELMNTEEVCPEQARMILPQSMYTEFIETASLAGYARLVQLRTAAGAQKEIRDYANLLSELLAPHFPVSWEALKQLPFAQEEPIMVQAAVKALEASV
jgi:thymidylate synthase (FAD)